MNNLIWLLFSFKGRISRKPYWVFLAAIILIILLPVIMYFDMSTEAEADNFVTLMLYIILWSSLAIQAKRWHDRNKSGWWILINFIPVIGAIWSFIENALLPGTEGRNRFDE